MPNDSLIARLRALIQKILPPALENDPNEPMMVVTLQPVMEAQAEVMRSRLEAEGIACMISRERTYYIAPIQLRVRRADLDEARAILKEMENDA